MSLDIYFNIDNNQKKTSMQFIQYTSNIIET